MRRLLIGIVLAVTVGGAGMTLAQDKPPDSPDTGGAPGHCATPLASPADGLDATPVIDTATPEASPASSLDCGTPAAGTPAS
jgi:hypothetical protein